MNIDTNVESFREFENLKIEVRDFLNDYYKDKDGIKNSNSSHAPSYLSNKWLLGESHINAFGPKETLVFDLINIINMQVENINKSGVPLSDNNFFQILCEVYDQKHGTHFAKNNLK